MLPEGKLWENYKTYLLISSYPQSMTPHLSPVLRQLFYRYKCPNMLFIKREQANYIYVVTFSVNAILAN